ncbi:MAG TPA: ATP-binding cassette domain-containing protein, partial [Spirochaetes bacterium]|nr:ATP-binding cassette domain-containing protein [Spirochaetota bacterium]
MVIVKNLSYGSEGRILIYPFSLSLDDGSVTGVVGKSGAGKSLMLKLLAGETGGYDGAIEINGRELSAIPARERHKLLSY